MAFHSIGILPLYKYYCVGLSHKTTYIEICECYIVVCWKAVNNFVRYITTQWIVVKVNQTGASATLYGPVLLFHFH